MEELTSNKHVHNSSVGHNLYDVSKVLCIRHVRVVNPFPPTKIFASGGSPRPLSHP